MSFRYFPVRVRYDITSVTISHGSGAQNVCGRTTGHVENEARLPSLDEPCNPARSVPKENFVGSERQFHRAVHTQTVWPFSTTSPILLAHQRVGVAATRQLHRLRPAVCGLQADAVSRP